MSDDTQQETFEAFKNSFAYGSRTDLNFKFLKGLPVEDAAQFFQDLLWKLGDSFNDGQFDRVVELMRVQDTGLIPRGHSPRYRNPLEHRA
jgi:hypothetical protein